MTKTPTEKAAVIMQHYGVEKQLTLLCEECSELIKEACKCRRKGVAMHDDMIEEMADVKIMLMQFESIMRLGHKKLLEKTITEKLDRQLKRIENERTSGEMNEYNSSNESESVIHAYWEISSDGYYPYCSLCKNEPESGKRTYYCPNCGAKMYYNKRGGDPNA